MDTKKRKLLRFAYFISLAVISLVVTGFVVRFSGRLKPINKNNLPYEFLVVGKTSDSSYSLLTLSEYSYSIQRSVADQNEQDVKGKRHILWPDEEIVWAEDIPKYEYYIRKSDLTGIVKNLNNLNRRFDAGKIKISVLDDDSSIKKQTICLIYAPESIHRFLYQVENKEVRPLQYGHFTKRDGWRAFLAGSLVFVVGFVFFKKVVGKYIKKLVA